MALIDTAIKAAKPASKAFKLSDEKGLYLFIPMDQSTGALIIALKPNGKRWQ